MPKIHPNALGKIGTTTPTRITNPILALCNEIAPGVLPAYVPVVPQSRARMRECFENVRKTVELSSGRILYGWLIWEWPRVLIELEHHAVWDDGSSLTDITPHADGEKRVLFLPDPERTFDFVSQVRTINIKRAHDFVPEAQAWIDAEEQLARYMVYKVPAADGAILSPAAMRHVARSTESKSDLIAALARRTGPNDPCFCGGRRKFKACCDPLIQLHA